MEDFNSKYTGKEVEQMLDQVANGSVGGGAYSEVNHGTDDTTFILTPNTFHVWDEVVELALTLGAETVGVANEYLFQFTSGTAATSLTLPGSIKWANNDAPAISANMIYQISILNGLATALEFSNEADLPENIGTYSSGSFMDGATLTFQYPVASDITILLDYGSSVVLPAGETTARIYWDEPIAPTIVSLSPLSDTTYKYIIL